MIRSTHHLLLLNLLNILAAAQGTLSSERTSEETSNFRLRVSVTLSSVEHHPTDRKLRGPA